MRRRSAVAGTLIIVVSVLLASAAGVLALWAVFVQPYGENSLTYVVSPVLALAYAAVGLVGLRIALRRRQR